LRRLVLIVKNDIKRRLRSPLVILVLLLTPILMSGIIGAIFAPKSGQSQLPKIDLLVVDKDKNFGSQLLLGAFASNQMEEMFQITLVEEAKGKNLISRGKASALIIIPEHFTNRLIKAETTQLTVIKNPAEQFLPNVVEEFMNTLAVIISGLVRIFEPELKAIAAVSDLPIEKVSITSMVPFLEAGRTKIARLKQYLDPLLIKLKEEIASPEEKKAGPALNVFSYILPGMSIMFLLFIIEIFLRDLLTEREDGKLQRMMFSPLRTAELILARIISGWFMGILVYLVIIVLGILLFDISWGNYLYLFLLIAVTCFWIAAFFALMNAFFKNKNQAGALVSPIILAFSAFGGSILPVNQLPSGIHRVADFTLNHWFIQGTWQIRDGSFPALPFTVILATGIMLFAAASFFLKKRITI
jgi:ABC-2 type transport system permease protein